MSQKNLASGNLLITFSNRLDPDEVPKFCLTLDNIPESKISVKKKLSKICRQKNTKLPSVLEQSFLGSQRKYSNILQTFIHLDSWLFFQIPYDVTVIQSYIML